MSESKQIKLYAISAIISVSATAILTLLITFASVWSNDKIQDEKINKNTEDIKSLCTQQSNIISLIGTKSDRKEVNNSIIEINRDLRTITSHIMNKNEKNN